MASVTALENRSGDAADTEEDDDDEEDDDAGFCSPRLTPKSEREKTYMASARIGHASGRDGFAYTLFGSDPALPLVIGGDDDDDDDDGDAEDDEDDFDGDDSKGSNGDDDDDIVEVWGVGRGGGARVRIVSRSPVQSTSDNAIARTSAGRAASVHDRAVNACAYECTAKSEAAVRQRVVRRV